MSNKTSDKNVGSIEKISQTSDNNVANIEDDVKILNNFCEFEDAVVLTDYALTLVQEAIINILAEREQDKKRIQELEEENKRKDMFVEMAKEVIENSIPTQVVIDLIKKETIDISGFKCIAVEDLQELLEGEK